MFVRIVRSVSLAKDGINSSRHEVGEVLDLSHGLASALLRDGYAADPQKAEEPAGTGAVFVADPSTDELPNPEISKELPAPTPKKQYRNRN